MAKRKVEKFSSIKMQTRKVVGAKTHQCRHCGFDIIIGQQYVTDCNNLRGKWCVDYMHRECYELVKELNVPDTDGLVLQRLYRHFLSELAKDNNRMLMKQLYICYRKRVIDAMRRDGVVQ